VLMVIENQDLLQGYELGTTFYSTVSYSLMVNNSIRRASLPQRGETTSWQV
jgi:hypothetical protein